MADKLNFSLVSPERELFSGAVDQVDLPGSEGRLGILPNHSPLMAALSAGVVNVMDGGKETRYLVQGGFADVTPSGLTVLAESSTAFEDLSKDALQSRIDTAKATLQTLEGDDRLALDRDINALIEIFETL